MAKTKISEYDVVAANNTDVDGINIAESCPPSGINNAIREVMAHLKDFQSGVSADDLTIAGTMTASGTLDVTGGLQLGSSAGTSGQVLVSSGSGTPAWGDAFVSGMIMIWSGSVASIPSGWVLCDGNNSTPNLTDKFVVGAGNTYAVNATGGSADAIVVEHTHTGSTASAGNHRHQIGNSTNSGGYDVGGWSGPYMMASGVRCCTWNTTTYTEYAGDHTHTITMDNTGSSGTNANLPPYYALAYIMKT